MGDRGDRHKLEEAAAAARSVSSRQCGVLVVENDPDLQWRLARMLTVQGHRVVGTSSGGGALALLAEWPVDLVLVDEDLPGMDGIEVARRIRELSPEIPVVLMAANDCQRVTAEHGLSGLAACVVKPFRLEAMRELIESMALPLVEPAE